MIIVQALDAAIGVAIKDAVKTRPAATAIANGAALIFLMMSPKAPSFAS